MKALAGILLAVALAVGAGSEANAQPCPSGKRDAKHVTRNSVKQRSKLAKSSSNKNKSSFCFCQLTKKKSKTHRTGMIKTNTYAGYMPATDIPPTTGTQESDLFPSNPLPTPQGEWDNTGRDLRRYPPESSAPGDVNTNTNTNANMNWLESSELQKNQAQQQQQQQQPVDMRNQGGGKQVPTQQQMPTEQQNSTEQPKNQ